MTAFLDKLRLSGHDWLDILIVAIIIYQGLLFIKGTRAFQMLIGLAVIVLAYLLSRNLKLSTLEWLLNNFISYIILIVIILFQDDIRRVLTTMGKGPFFRSSIEQNLYLEEAIRAAYSLASNKVGALIVFERTTKLNQYIETGKIIDARLSRELLISIFIPSSPLHDGAVIIQNGRIYAAGCLLPLNTEQSMSIKLGTRHRAGLGMSLETDAVVIVVSEERGQVSLVANGRISWGIDREALREELFAMFKQSKPKKPSAKRSLTNFLAGLKRRREEKTA
ncbi:MAG: TIGR00159 family protein [Deltaproteobacteria bacterium]|nr:TIGR00159 family protein [Deltaproteobacteria bacterium]